MLIQLNHQIVVRNRVSLKTNISCVHFVPTQIYINMAIGSRLLQDYHAFQKSSVHFFSHATQTCANMLEERDKLIRLQMRNIHFGITISYSILNLHKE